MIYRKINNPKLRRVRLWQRPVLMVSMLIILAAAFVLSLALTGRGPFRHNQDANSNSPSHSATPSTKGETPSTAISSSDTDQDGTGSSDNKTGSDNKPASGQPPKAPEGNFVSSHKASLSGKTYPSGLQSSCLTTPGASCQISFTKDGVTKYLSLQKADAGGGVYWTWSLQDVGLTVGSWQIKATATMLGQTATSNDALALEVSP